MAVDRSEDNRGSVCIVRHSFYPFELNVKREAEALLEDGFEVHVICLRGENEAAYEVVEGVEVHRLPVGHRRGRIGSAGSRISIWNGSISPSSPCTGRWFTRLTSRAP